jgi:excisionase family DNA binding protein
MSSPARAEITGRRVAFSISEVAAQTSICRSKLYEAIARGDLEALKDGKRTIITADAIQKYMQSLPRLTLNRQPPRNANAIPPDRVRRRGRPRKSSAP